ncbi:MAG TPA: endolytic transglycosylase MltG [Jatrophihabitans sp.]
MTQRERESVQPALGDDPHSLLFGDADGDGGDSAYDAPRLTRAERRRNEQGRRKRVRRRGRLFVVLALVIVAAVAYFVVPRVIDYFRVQDYSGNGTGSVLVAVHSGDSTQDIGDSMQKAGVVKSAKAFTDACGDTRCASIQPGEYRMRQHMSGASAVALILNPSTKSNANVLVIPEGATGLDVEARLVKILGSGAQAGLTAALKKAGDLGLPLNYTGKGDGVPSSAEGFLYPATYQVDPTSSPTKVLQDIVARYLQQDRNTGFADAAKRQNLTPYEALTIASIAQSEAKYPQDMPKVARTILNRIKIGRALQFDSTSSYACKLAQTPASKCIYNQVISPYNTYTHEGLPPTPIDNPGAPAMAAAVAPAKGDWIYFVNVDAAGHLGFFDNEKAFTAAVEKCKKNHWGCG